MSKNGRIVAQGVANLKLASILLVVTIQPTNAFAHHSATPFFDDSNKGEISGTVTEVRWKNPHISYKIDVVDQNGKSVEWTIEGNAVNTLQRIGVSKDVISVGDKIKVWGPLGKNGKPVIRGYNVLLASGEEIVLLPHVSSERHWDDVKLVETTGEIEFKDISRANEEAMGIFRVWTQGDIVLVNDFLPLTPSAIASRKRYNPATDNPALKCIAPGVPMVMDVSTPLEFEKQGDDIVLQMEQWGTTRVIHMGTSLQDAKMGRPSREGFSVGRWDHSGMTLLVETTNIDTIYFDEDGTPQSAQARVLEEFTVSDDENTLYWRSVTTDPENFTEPVIFEQTFTWVPGETVKSFDCELEE